MEFAIECSTVIAVIGQSVERTLAEGEGLQVTTWGIAADERTMATNTPGVFAGGDAVLGADLAVRAAIFRAIEKTPRVPLPAIRHDLRLTSFLEIEGRLPQAEAQREARRCLSCGCRKADCCQLRSLATEYNVDPYRFAGGRRRFSQDTSHADIIYEPGKCILCGACVRIAEQEGEPFGGGALRQDDGGRSSAGRAPLRGGLSQRRVGSAYGSRMRPRKVLVWVQGWRHGSVGSLSVWDQSRLGQR